MDYYNINVTRGHVYTFDNKYITNLNSFIRNTGTNQIIHMQLGLKNLHNCSKCI